MIPTVSLPSLAPGSFAATEFLLTPLPALVASLLPSPGTTLHALPRPDTCISALRKKNGQYKFTITPIYGVGDTGFEPVSAA